MQQARSNVHRRSLYIIPIFFTKPSFRVILEILLYLIPRLFLTVYLPNGVLLVKLERYNYKQVKIRTEILSYLPTSLHFRTLMRYYILPLYNFIKIIKYIDSVLIVQSLHYPILLILLAKLLHRHVYLYIGGDQVTVLSFLIPFAKPLRKVMLGWLLLKSKFVLNLADKVLFISYRLLENNLYSKKNKSKICVALNFPGINFFSYFQMKKKIQNRDPVIGYVGAFTHYKGFHRFIKAIPVIIKRKPDIKIMIIGDPNSFYPRILKKLTDKIVKRYPKNILFLGYIPHRILPKYLNEMRLLILPSFTEGIPHVILEAMACGTPVLATPIGGIPEIIQDGVTGFLLRNPDPYTIANKVLELLDNLNALSKVSIAANLRVKEFTFKKAVIQWKQCLFEV